MENFFKEGLYKRFLFCTNPDNESVAKLSEKFVPGHPQLDAIIAIGPFHCVQDTSFTSQQEEDASKIADIASIIAQLENIVCRVIYLPSQKDPSSITVEESHLTPNSITLHGRKISLLKNLHLYGYSEPDLTTETSTDVLPDEGGQYECLEDIRVKSARSVDIIRDVMKLDSHFQDHQEPIADSGIFTLVYHFSHTLNHFLFHMSEELEEAAIVLCIISSTNAEETSRLPTKFGNLTIVVPGNLHSGNYTLVDMEFNITTNRWEVANVDHQTL